MRVEYKKPTYKSTKCTLAIYQKVYLQKDILFLHKVIYTPDVFLIKYQGTKSLMGLTPHGDC